MAVKRRLVGFMSILMHFIKHEPVYEPYKDLKQILEGKDFDIVTTNQDHQFVKAFPEKDVAIIQGDWTYLQCSKRCHDEVYPVEDLIDQWYSNVQNGKLPSEFIPHCQKCGAELHEWVRGFDTYYIISIINLLKNPKINQQFSLNWVLE